MEKQSFLNKIENLLVQFDRNFSSIMVMDKQIAEKIEKKMEKLKKACAEIEDEEKKHLFQNHYNNRYNMFMILHNSLSSELENIRQEYEEKVEENYRPFDIETSVGEKSIWDLAVRLTYERYHTEYGIKNYTEWKESLSKKNLKKMQHGYDEISNECYRTNALLCRIHDKILPIYLTYMGIYDYTSITRSKEKSGTSSNASNEVYVKPDVLFLLSCCYSFMCDNEKKWKRKENKNDEEETTDEDYGRSFLRNGKGILRCMLRESLIHRFVKFLYLDAKGRELKNTLFVFPRSIYQDLFWSTTINFEELCDPLYAKTVRFVMSEYIQKEIDKKKTIIDEVKQHNNTVRDYEKTSYSMVDDLYWTLQYQQMEDFVSGLDRCLNNTKFSSLKYDMVAMLDQICIKFNFPNIFDSENSKKTNFSKEKIDQVALRIATWFIMNNFMGYKGDSLARCFRRQKNELNILYRFYEQGIKCFRNTDSYLDDFTQVAFFEPMLDRCDFVQSYIRETYIKGMLAVVFIVLGREKVFPIEVSGNEKNASLYKIIQTYATEKVDDRSYAVNGTYYLLWNCLNEILEWGFGGAKIINDFRKYVFLVYCHNAGIGLKDGKQSVTPVTMDSIRMEVFLDYDKWLCDAGARVKALMYKRIVRNHPLSREIFGAPYSTCDMADIFGLGNMRFSEILESIKNKK